MKSQYSPNISGETLLSSLRHTVRIKDLLDFQDIVGDQECENVLNAAKIKTLTFFKG